MLLPREAATGSGCALLLLLPLLLGLPVAAAPLLCRCTALAATLLRCPAVDAGAGAAAAVGAGAAAAVGTGARPAFLPPTLTAIELLLPPFPTGSLAAREAIRGHI